MPYIKQEEREVIDKLVFDLKKEIKNKNIKNCNQLNYIFTQLIHTFIETNGKNYQNLNNVIGLLDCVKLEYYRRIVSVYEDEKFKENGDVFQTNMKWL